MASGAGKTSGKTISEKHRKAMLAGKRTGSVAKKLGLCLAPQRILRLLRRGGYAKKASPACGIFLAGALEWLILEIFEGMMEAAKRSKSKMLLPKHITNAITNDEELSHLLGNAIILRGGTGRSIAAAAAAAAVVPNAVKKKKPSKSKSNSKKNHDIAETGSGIDTRNPSDAEEDEDDEDAEYDQDDDNGRRGKGRHEDDDDDDEDDDDDDEDEGDHNDSQEY